MAQIDIGTKAEQVADLSSKVKAQSVIVPNRKIVVDGRLDVDVWWQAAEEIEFKNNGELVFTSAASEKRSELFVVCRKITVVSGVGRITWQKTAPPAPADRGQAANGVNGQGEGGHGGAGADGQTGAIGRTGTDAPDFTIFLQTLAGTGNLEIDFSGASGGVGGLGQTGGTGGNGERGAAARQGRTNVFGATVWQPWCEPGPGQGGNGGPGGRGGDGGIGGLGGRGGTITICADPARIPVLRQAIQIRNDGGTGGEGGAPGSGGAGGNGGSEGQLANFCNSAGRNGSPGVAGAAAQKGAKGTPGTQGAQFDANLTDDQWEKLFKA